LSEEQVNQVLDSNKSTREERALTAKKLADGAKEQFC
jgi:hypothetical protein